MEKAGTLGAQVPPDEDDIARCDKCGAKAGMRMTLKSGILYFCMHHYNENAQALTTKGAVAKLLISSK